MSKAQRFNLALGIISSALALGFAVIYILGTIKFLDNFLVLIYMIYFIGLAFMFTAGYHKQAGNKKSSRLFLVISFLAIIASVIMLVIGLVKGWVDFYIWPF